MNLLLLLVLGALWGSSYLFIKVAVAEVPPLTMVAGRLAVGALILWALLLISGRSMPRGRTVWGRYAVVGVLNGVVPYSLVFWSEQQITSGLAALLQATMPLFTVLLSHVLSEDERLTVKKGLGVIVGFAGVGLLMLPDLRQGMESNLLGQLAVIGSSASYAAAAIYARSRLRRQAPLVATTGQLTMGAAITIPLCLLVGQPFDLSPSGAALGSWLALTVLGTVVAYLIYYALIERTSATFVSTVTYIIPVNGLLLGALVLGEVLTSTLVLGLALILSGVLLVRV
jgi:drug/metabolite transporter (DMT)-like permease